MALDFAFYLTALVIVLAVVVLLDVLIWRKQRGTRKQPLLIEYARSFFPVLLAVWVIRSFIIQPYRVPTGSLEPTVLPGDFIAVNQFAYGFRLPVLNKKIISVAEPKRGDIALFHWPKNPAIVFVKRVIGLPGDHVVYKNKVLYINGKEMSQHFISTSFDYGDAPGQIQPVSIYEENLEGVKHQIFIHPQGGETKNYDVNVPADHYFMMGDNRDNSDDSRFWGAVPEKNFIGKAFGIWLSWDPLKSFIDKVLFWNSIRWHRIGKGL